MHFCKKHFFIYVCDAEAEKQAQVARIQWDQKIMEKESEQKIAEIEGEHSIAITQSMGCRCKVFSFIKPFH